VLEDDATVHCWGGNAGSALLLADPHVMLPTAQAIPGADMAVQVAVGDEQQLLVRADGSVVGWGGSQYGELGVVTPDVTGPGPIPTLSGTVAEVGASSNCSCARMTDGTVQCWGSTSAGCLGNASMTMGTQPLPTAVVGVKDAVQLRVGSYETPTCVRDATGYVLCWNDSTTPGPVPGVSDATDIAVGINFVFIQSQSKGLLWSSSTASGWRTAQVYDTGGAVAAIAAGNSFVALRVDGTVVWASLDNAMTPPKPTPISGQPAGTVVEIAAGYGFSYHADYQCLRMAAAQIAGSVYCWGDDGNGALGNGAKDAVTTPVTVPGVTGATSLTTAQSSTSTVVGGAVVFWGWARGLDPNDPISVTATPQTSTAYGTDNTLVRTNDVEGSAYLLKQSKAPVVLTYGNETGCCLSTDANIVDALLFSSFQIGREAGGLLVAFGPTASSNSEGIFGDGTTTCTAGEVEDVPVGMVSGFSAYGDDYNPGPAHACAVAGAGVLCWGDNGSGELGNGPPDGQAHAYPKGASLPGNATVVSVAAARNFSCAVNAAGTIYCWGQNGNGQLGTGHTSAPTGTPQQVVGISNAVGVSAREDHACAWLTDGTVKCWGTNREGQLGDGTFDDSATPVVAIGVQSVVEVSAGTYFTCARHMGGTISCWGSSYYGQVGTGVTGHFVSPQMVLGL
jgi:alpha-tubulin suppressor-like RCC1 family protein